MGNQSLESGLTASTSLHNLLASMEEGPFLHKRLGSMEEGLSSLHPVSSMEEGLSSLHLGSMEDEASSTVAVELGEQMERLNINNNQRRPARLPRNRKLQKMMIRSRQLRNVNTSITFSMRQALFEEHLRRKRANARANAFSMLLEQQRRHLLEHPRPQTLAVTPRHLLEHPRPQTLAVMLAMNAPATTTTSSNAVAANARVSQSEPQCELDFMPESTPGTTTTTTSSNAVAANARVSQSEPQLELEWPELELESPGA